jgi:hypothetical protein
MHKSATKCNETLGKWCKNKHGASKIIDTLETYHEPHWALWRQIFAVRRTLNYKTGGFNCSVRPDVDYFMLRTPENNPSWRTRWFYARDKPAIG